MPVFARGQNLGLVSFKYMWLVGPKTALGGQVLTVDRGAGLYENFSRLYQERDVRPIVTRRQP